MAGESQQQYGPKQWFFIYYAVLDKFTKSGDRIGVIG